jgi:Asp-tRNA(Asn)/Glu-tRNA(Gln) amidotransferase A subunit family amidase
MPTEYGSKRYEGHQIGEDARIVKLLRAKGCLIFGKSHCTEFACGPGHPVHPPTRNPHDIKRSPGASSSGSAAAVADYEVTLAIGTQTGGSIIVPASFCGIYAWKPTFNLLALGGAFSVAPSLDTLGFFSRSVDDLMMLAELFEIKTLPVKEPLHKPRIAWVPTSVDVPADEDALQVIEAAVSALERAGFKMKKISLPPVFAGGHKVAQTIFLKECVASFQAELAEGTDGITEGNLEMVEMGKAVSWEDYTGAREAIGHAREAFLGILDDGYDALLTLSASGEAPVADYAAGVPVYASIWTVRSPWKSNACCSADNIRVQAIGVPVINLPGWGGNASMPIGLSLIGREHEDRALLEHARAVGSVFERDGNWRNRL